MAVSIRLAPGVKIRLGRRGAWWSLGPRAARLHVGAGHAGVSTGAGPVTFYRRLGRRKRRRQ